jgi:hypothetical protein
MIFVQVRPFQWNDGCNLLRLEPWTIDEDSLFGDPVDQGPVSRDKAFQEQNSSPAGDSANEYGGSHSELFVSLVLVHL